MCKRWTFLTKAALCRLWWGRTTSTLFQNKTNFSSGARQDAALTWKNKTRKSTFIILSRIYYKPKELVKLKGMGISLIATNKDHSMAIAPCCNLTFKHPDIQSKQAWVEV